MNFLAHVYLSQNDPKVMVGNFIGDFVKGRNLYDQYEPGIAKGIELHRLIDDFTDKHPVVLQSKYKLRPKYRHYAPVIIDIFYDHFLAANWSQYHPQPLADFAGNVYRIINEHTTILPQEVKYLLPYMINGNWLVNYAYTEGIHRALTGMSRRTTFNSRMDEAIVELHEYYDEFKNEFNEFFPALNNICQDWLQNLKEP